MNSINLKEHIELIHDLVNQHISASVEIVDIIERWCEEHPELVKTEDRCSEFGMAFWNHPTEPDRIILKQIITEDDIENQTLAMYMSGFERVYYHIENELDYLMHLVLHETAHIKHNWLEDREIDCDIWAFDQLKKIKKAET